jgi:hypothetical protein
MKRTTLRRALILGFFVGRAAYGAGVVEFSGRVSTLSDLPIAQVHVSLYRSGHWDRPAAQVVTDKEGLYKLQIPTGADPIDFLVFQQDSWLPKVVAGPFPGRLGGQLNVILSEKTIKATPEVTALMQLQTYQFLALILREKVYPPETFEIPSKIAFAKMCLPSKDIEMTPDAPKQGLWFLGDAFFEGAAPKP